MTRATFWGLIFLIGVTVGVLGSPEPVPIHPAPRIVPLDTLDHRSPEERRREAVTLQALRFGVNPELMLAMSFHENPSAEGDTWSWNRCCIGNGQINVRVWYGRFHDVCGGSDLLDPMDNACYQVQIWLWHLERCDGDEVCALVDYSGGARNYQGYVESQREEAARWLEEMGL